MLSRAGEEPSPLTSNIGHLPKVRRLHCTFADSGQLDVTANPAHRFASSIFEQHFGRRG